MKRAILIALVLTLPFSTTGCVTWVLSGFKTGLVSPDGIDPITQAGIDASNAANP